jgi:ribosomal protein S18 acetylase RimI-like enzyme
MTANPSISLATRRDVPALAALHASVAREMTREFGKGGWSEYPTVAGVKRQLGASRVLVARCGGDVVGTVRLTKAQPALFDAAAFTPVAKAYYVLGLAVAPGARRRGLGRALMESAKEATLAAPMDALWLDVYDHPAGAGSFYEKCGFRKVGAVRHQQTLLIGYEWLVTRQSVPNPATFVAKR